MNLKSKLDYAKEAVIAISPPLGQSCHVGLVKAEKVTLY